MPAHHNKLLVGDVSRLTNHPPSRRGSAGDSPGTILANSLDLMRDRNGGIIRLFQFAHDSPGLRAYRDRVGDALVYQLEQHGYVITRIEREHPPEDK